ncbi:hypothetical protein KY314_05195 [Candidatus Woesearchaeota archaeon]|nr:hypothetical protein [Candidatus Woesearchaeota archaeon]
MTIIGMQFDKISVEKMNPLVGKVSINNNVTIKKLEKTQITLGKNKQDVLRFTYEYKADYEPKIALITLLGTLTYLEKPEKIEELLKQWKKDKNLPKEILTPILNNIYTKCNVQALVMAREINLPPPIQLPKVTLK